MVQSSRRFISLKWKTLALVSLVLAAVHLGLVSQGYFDEIRQFEARQALAFESRIRVMQKLFDQSSERLSRIATIVPGVINTINMRGGAVAAQWESVQVELQLEVMQMYGADGRVLIPGLPLWRGAPPAALTERIAAALRDERPAGFLLCDPTCIQYGLTPILGSSGERQLMVLGVSLADVVLAYPGLAGADVALLVERGADGMSYWNRYRLVAISDAPNNEPKLRTLTERVHPEDVEQGRSLEYGGREYRFHARRLDSFGSLTPGYVLIFDDTTEALAGIRSQLRRQLGVGLTALLAALALLLSILNRPMNQLRKLAQALPMLAQQQYGPVRDMVGTAWRDKHTHSEIEVLEEAAANLSRTLEELEKTVAARNAALAEKVAELKRANELNEKIFATAPVIFVIQSHDGRILQMNEFGSQLLGYSESEVKTLPFLQLLADARQRQHAGDILTDVLGGRRQLFEQTGPVRCVDGSLERVTWLHTRLPAEGADFLLSVGVPDKALPGQAAHGLEAENKPN